MQFALSDPKEPCFQAECDHDHADDCDRCALLSTSISELDAALEAHIHSLPPAIGEELTFRARNAKAAILAWKSHLLRSVNQDRARLELLDKLEDTSVLIIQDWAMKFLPRKYRESQSDWFGKRGIPWHLTVATRRVRDEFETLTFAHIFKSCTQDSPAVIAVMADIVQQLKIVMPELKIVYYRQDNAGCYHCGSTIVCPMVLGRECGVTVKRLDFSDPQGGKAACDRKAASIKSHMRIHLNSGHDIETPTQMKEAILSSGGVRGVSVALCESVHVPEVISSKIEGISQFSNIQYEAQGLRVWKAFNIGPGKVISQNRLQVPSSRQLPSLTGVVRSGSRNFVSIAERRTKQLTTASQALDTDAQDGKGEEAKDEAVFTCPEEGCTKTFLRFSSMQRHLDCGKHHLALEQHTLLDHTAIAYAQKLEGQSEAVPELTVTVAQPPSSRVTLPKGWALKTTTTRRRFSDKQKKYMTTKFQQGERSGRKHDPASVARSMMTAVDTSGARMFTSEDFLTTSQVAGFFSRLAAKKSLDDHETDFDEEVGNASREVLIDTLTQAASQELLPGHPITCNGRNLCDMDTSNFYKLTIANLKEICSSLDIAVSTNAKRKLPYVEAIDGFCQMCGCKDKL